MKITLARPRGFCAGVERAVSIVETALQKYGTPIYVKHAIVHNTHVVEQLERQGAIFVENLEDIPLGAQAIFSAHGVPPQDHIRAKERRLSIIDATCPLVTKVHLEARRFSKLDYFIILIGHEGHVEVKGTYGEAPERMIVVGTEEEAQKVVIPPQFSKLCYLTQTTLSVDDTQRIVDILKSRFPNLESPPKKDICYATQNRQDAVRKLAAICDTIFVVGSNASSNSHRLVEVAESCGAEARLVDDKNTLRPEWLEGVKHLGITAGASAPEKIVKELVEYLAETYSANIKELTAIEENVHFPLPKNL